LASKAHAFADCAALHRAQAAMLNEMDMEVKVVDIWTEYGRFPWNKMAAGYPFCCKYPIIWKAMFYTTIGKSKIVVRW
jgi:1,2-diacylglycerol 3-beta-galactosyltransferase